MNPPNVYDAEGHVYPDRRHHGRRVTDLDPELGEEIERGFARWARIMFLNRGKIMTIAAGLGAIGGFLFGFLGRLHDLDALTSRVVRLETAQAATADDVKNLKSAARVQSYILCLSVPGDAPDQAQRACKKILEEGLTPP